MVGQCPYIIAGCAVAPTLESKDTKRRYFREDFLQWRLFTVFPILLDNVQPKRLMLTTRPAKPTASFLLFQNRLTNSHFWSVCLAAHRFSSVNKLLRLLLSTVWKSFLFWVRKTFQWKKITALLKNLFSSGIEEHLRIQFLLGSVWRPPIRIRRSRFLVKYHSKTFCWFPSNAYQATGAFVTPEISS